MDTQRARLLALSVGLLVAAGAFAFLYWASRAPDPDERLRRDVEELDRTNREMPRAPGARR